MKNAPNDPRYRWFFPFFLGLVLVLALVSPAYAGEEGIRPEASSEEESYQGAVVCPPWSAGLGCTTSGPQDTLWRLAQEGWRPDVDLFPGVRLTDEWFRLPQEKLFYAWVKADKARMYRDPVADEGPQQTVAPGFVYVSYTGTRVFGTQRWALVDNEKGLWMPMSDLEPTQPSTFRGFYFIEPPTRPFGWVVYRGVQPRMGPGWEYPAQDFGLRRYQRIEVLEREERGDEVWYRIGPDMWVPRYVVGIVEPRTSPPPGVPSDRWIEVNVLEQTLSVYENNRLVYATLISSGTGVFFTRVGVFQIYEKKSLETMQGSFLADRSDYYYLEDVPWTMYYDGARAIHGTYWHDNFGFKESRGCVNLSIVDAYWVFQWAQEGDWVYVYDPSGQTPAVD